jgi:hypothetical protein
MLILVTILFILLSPGLVFTLPPGSKGAFFSQQTSTLSVILSGVIFYLILWGANNNFLGLDIINKLEPTLLGSNY